jgi:cell division protein FtsW
MTDQPIFLPDDELNTAEPLRPTRAVPRPQAAPEAPRASERPRSFLSVLDTPVMVIVGILLAIGLMMVYSTTFDWSYQDYGDEAAIFMQHARNVAIGAVIGALLIFIDYRIWKRFAVALLLVTFALLVGVLLFGDNTFGARRSFINGSYQPGELAELIIIMYLAAWLGSKRARIRSLTQGLIPFLVLVGSMVFLVVRQPDISTAAMIFAIAFVMYFLAGASLLQLGAIVAMVGAAAVVVLQLFSLSYAEDRVASYLASTTDITQANYHVLQAIVAFDNGGWTGVGLGQGRQKFGFLPAPHTDSIFAVIGEELGIIGATAVVALYVVFMIRGFQIARRSHDSFGALMAAGITTWVTAKALLNVAVMTAALPATGAPLPFISFGGSSLVVMMAGAGLLLSVARVAAREAVPERRKSNQRADYDRSGGDRGTRVSGAGYRRGAKPGRN